jgi:hypothetical protein
MTTLTPSAGAFKQDARAFVGIFAAAVILLKIQSLIMLLSPIIPMLAARWQAFILRGPRPHGGKHRFVAEPAGHVPPA